MIQILILSLGLSAAGIADDAKFKAAKQLYTELEYEDALKSFNKIAGRSGLSGEDQARVQLWIGLCRAGTGDLGGARASFARGVELAPDLPLPLKASPKIDAMYKEVQDAARARADAAAAEAAAANPPSGDSGASSSEQSSDEAAQSEDEESGRGLSVLFLGGASAAALGAATLLGGAVFSGLAYSELGTAVDREQYQDDANAALENATGNNTIAMICYGTGATLWALGAVMATVDVVAGE